jgi:glycosyltransferase involved in cell wall biosynthesis
MTTRDSQPLLAVLYTAMSNPKVTIAIPTYNRSKLVVRAIGSALEQTYADIEVIVCNDASTDDTVERVANISDPRLRLFTHPRNVGSSQNYNFALKQARGEFFTALMDDDYFEPTCIEALLTPWHKFPSLAFSYGQFWKSKNNEKTLMASRGPEREAGLDYIVAWWSGDRATLLHSALFRTCALRAIGGFPTVENQDVHAQLRLAFDGEVAHVRTPCSTYCEHAGTITKAMSPIKDFENRAALFAMCLGEMRSRSIPLSEDFAQMLHKRFSYWACTALLLAGSVGATKSTIIRQSWHLRPFLARNLWLSVPVVAGCVALPSPALAAFRRAAKATIDHPVSRGRQ